MADSIWLFWFADGLAAFCTVTRRPSWHPERVYLVRCCAGLQLLEGLHLSATFQLLHTGALILILLCRGHAQQFF
jgi:hypothetical protein